VRAINGPWTLTDPAVIPRQHEQRGERARPRVRRAACSHANPNRGRERDQRGRDPEPSRGSQREPVEERARAAQALPAGIRRWARSRTPERRRTTPAARHVASRDLSRRCTPASTRGGGAHPPASPRERGHHHDPRRGRTRGMRSRGRGRGVPGPNHGASDLPCLTKRVAARSTEVVTSPLFQ